MKAHSSRLVTLLALMPFISTALFSSSAIALGTATAATAKTESPFCTNITTTVTKVTTNLINLTKKRTDAEAAREKKIADNRAKWDKDLADSRAKWDTQRQENFTKLVAKASTDAQKAAVSTYEKAIITAVTARRAANDSARSTYRKGVDDAIAKRHVVVDGQVTTFTSSVDATIAVAQAACTSDPKSTTARETFRTSMKTARTTFMTDRQNDDKVATTVADLVKTRDAAIKANDTAFVTVTAAARDALKAAFKGTNI